MITRALISASGALVLAYLATTFAMWDANPAHWGTTARAATIYFGVLLAGVITPISLVLQARKEG